MNSFRPQPVYIADAFMLPVGRYDGRHRQKLSFLEMAATVHDLLDRSAIPLEKIDCVVVGSQNPFAFSGVDNVAAKIAGVLGISGADTPLRRFYRNAWEGLTELADSALKRLRRGQEG